MKSLIHVSSISLFPRHMITIAVSLILCFNILIFAQDPNDNNNSDLTDKELLELRIRVLESESFRMGWDTHRHEKDDKGRYKVDIIAPSLNLGRNDTITYDDAVHTLVGTFSANLNQIIRPEMRKALTARITSWKYETQIPDSADMLVRYSNWEPHIRVEVKFNDELSRLDDLSPEEIRRSVNRLLEVVSVWTRQFESDPILQSWTIPLSPRNQRR